MKHQLMGVSCVLDPFRNLFLTGLVLSFVLLNDLAYGIDRSAIEQLGFANGLFGKGLYQMAIDEYKKFIESHPESECLHEAYFGIAESLFFLESYSDAMDGYRRYIELFSGGEKAALSNLRLGQASFLINDYEGALEYLNKVNASALDGNFVQALNSCKSRVLYRQAEARLLSGNYTASLDMFKKILEAQPERDIYMQSLENLLISLFNLSRHEDLISEYLRNEKVIEKDSRAFNIYYITASSFGALDRYDESLPILDMALSSSANEGDRCKVLLKKTEMLLKLRRFNDARVLLENELENLPAERAHITYLKAEVFYGLGDFGMAYGLYKKIIDEFPDSPFSGDAVYGMAYTLSCSDKNREALESFIKYFKDGGDNAKRQDALYKAISIETELGMTEKVIEDSELYLKTFKDSALNERVLFQLGSVYSKVTRYAKAIDAYREFISRFKKSERLEEVYFLLAYNLQMSKRFDESLKYYGKILPDREKLFYAALKNMALIYLDKKEEDNAIKTFDRIITGFDKNDLGLDVYLWVGKYYFNNKNFSDSLRILNRMEGRGDCPQHEEINYLKAEAYRETQDFKNAVRHYDALLSIKSRYSVISRIGKGLCLVKLDDLDSARAEFEKAILECPDDNTITVRARFEIANIEKLKGNSEEACRLYMLVGILYRDDYYSPEALFRGGELFEALKKKKEAIKAYQEIIDTYKKCRLAEKAREKIKILSES